MTKQWQDWSWFVFLIWYRVGISYEPSISALVILAGLRTHQDSIHHHVFHRALSKGIHGVSNTSFTTSHESKVPQQRNLFLFVKFS
jgi:hypothetical protein